MAPSSRSVILTEGADLDVDKEKLQNAINRWRTEHDISFVFDETRPEEAGITSHNWWDPAESKEFNLHLVRDREADITYISVSTTVKKLRDKVLDLVAREFATQSEADLLAEAQKTPPPSHALLRLALSLQAAPTKNVLAAFAAGLASPDAATREDAISAAAATQSTKLLPALRQALDNEKNATLKKKLKVAIQLSGGDEPE